MNWEIDQIEIKLLVLMSPASQYCFLYRKRPYRPYRPY